MTHAPVTDRTRPVRSARRRAALSGVLAAAVTLAVAQLVAAVVSPPADPFVAVGDAFVDATPAWLKDFAIGAFGVHDKTALLVSMGLVIALVAAGVGMLARSRPWVGPTAVALLGAAGALAAATRPDAGYLAVVPSLLGTLGGVLALRALLVRSERVTGTQLAEPTVSAGPDRRSFLTAAAAVAVVATLASATGTAVGAAGRAAAAARDRLRLPIPRRAAPPVPPGAQGIPGVVDVVTRNEDFYRIDTALTVPRVDPDTWTLRVHGMVDEEVVLTLDELFASDLVEAYVTLACVSNPVGGELVGNARWLGLPVREVLRRARPQAGADMVLSRSVDGFTASTPLPVLTDDRDALIAVAMNGELLPPAHGFPVRLVVPGLYGYVSATKWLSELEVTRFADQDAYWTVRGWSPQGQIKTSSRIEVPRAGASVAAGDVAVGGTAWAQHRGITGVEVQVDDGRWQEATLADEIRVDTWRQWSWTWAAEPGRHVLRVRATDPVDGVQTGEVADVIPDGATGWHEIEVDVRPA